VHYIPIEHDEENQHDAKLHPESALSKMVNKITGKDAKYDKDNGGHEHEQVRGCVLCMHVCMYACMP
jgi:hypothetical protein